MQKNIARSLIALSICSVIGLVWIGFHQNSQSTIQQNPPIKIGVAEYPGFGTFFIAKEKGFFEKEGVNVEIVKLAPDAMIPALASGQVQLLTGSSDMMPIVASAGVDAVQIFSTSISFGADGIITKNDVRSIEDLKGKKVYLTLGYPDHFLFRMLAQKAGLKTGDVQLVDLPEDQVGSSFVAGSIDAGATWEPWLSKAMTRKDGKILLTSRDEPGIITDNVMVRRDLLQNRRQDVERIMRAFFVGVDYWETHEKEGNTIVAKNLGLSEGAFAPMKSTVKLSTYVFNVEKFDATKPLNVFEIVSKATNIFLEDGVIKAKPDMNKLTDASLLHELY